MDRKIEEDQVRESFVPLPDDMIKDHELARDHLEGNHGATGSEANNDGRSDSGYGGSTGTGAGGPGGSSDGPQGNYFTWAEEPSSMY